MKILIILLIVFVIYQIIRYLIILYNRSILPIYYSHGELVDRYAHYICNIDKNHCIIAIMDYKDTNITVRYLDGFRPYVLGDIVKISKFKNGIYYIGPETYEQTNINNPNKRYYSSHEYVKKLHCVLKLINHVQKRNRYKRHCCKIN